MIDTQSYLEKYRVLSPSEQNRELKELFDLLPEWITIRERRKHYLEATVLTRSILYQRWGLLLGLSLTTDSFKTHFIEQYEGFQRRGITKYSVQRYTDLFKWNRSGSGGIFWIEESQEIDSRAYHHLAAEHLSERAALIEAVNEGIINPSILKPISKLIEELSRQWGTNSELVADLRCLQEREERPRRWRLEHIALFNSLP